MLNYIMKPYLPLVLHIQIQKTKQIVLIKKKLIVDIDLKIDSIVT